MASLNLLSIHIFLVAAIAWAAQAQISEQVTWAKRVETPNEVITTLQFYFHDKLSGQNPSAMRIVQAPQTNNSSTLFGMLAMIDDLLTVGPDPSSKVVGRARGMYGSAGQTDVGLIMVLNYGFTDGIYNGSTFSLLSINLVMQPVREMAIVGGTGLFRLARGYALAHTYWLDATTGDAIVGNISLPQTHNQSITRHGHFLHSPKLQFFFIFFLKFWSGRASKPNCPCRSANSHSSSSQLTTVVLVRSRRTYSQRRATLTLVQARTTAACGFSGSINGNGSETSNGSGQVNEVIEVIKNY